MSESEALPTLTRTVTWRDPRPAIPKLLGMTGLEAMQAVVSGELPGSPFVEVLGIRVTEAEEGRAAAVGQPEDLHANPAGTVHGGFAASLLDSAIWAAVHSTLPAGRFSTTLQMSINYVRPLATNDGELRAEGRVLHRGRRTIVAEGSIVDANGKLCVHGTATCLILGD
jgi:uncharacterized protein (TIGR00369 family)